MALHSLRGLHRLAESHAGMWGAPDLGVLGSRCWVGVELSTALAAGPLPGLRCRGVWRRSGDSCSSSQPWVPALHSPVLAHPPRGLGRCSESSGLSVPLCSRDRHTFHRSVRRCPAQVGGTPSPAALLGCRRPPCPAFGAWCWVWPASPWLPCALFSLCLPQFPHRSSEGDHVTSQGPHPRGVGMAFPNPDAPGVWGRLVLSYPGGGPEPGRRRPHPSTPA